MENKIITVRQELHWHLISQYLAMIWQISVAHEDKVFFKMLEDVQSFVDNKLSVDGDIIENFVTVLYQPEK